MRHNTSYSTFAAKSDRKYATEYDGFEYVALPEFTGRQRCPSLMQMQRRSA